MATECADEVPAHVSCRTELPSLVPPPQVPLRAGRRLSQWPSLPREWNASLGARYGASLGGGSQRRQKVPLGRRPSTAPSMAVQHAGLAHRPGTAPAAQAWEKLRKERSKGKVALAPKGEGGKAAYQGGTLALGDGLNTARLGGKGLPLMLEKAGAVPWLAHPPPASLVARPGAVHVPPIVQCLTGERYVLTAPASSAPCHKSLLFLQPHSFPCAHSYMTALLIALHLTLLLTPLGAGTAWLPRSSRATIAAWWRRSTLHVGRHGGAAAVGEHLPVAWRRSMGRRPKRLCLARR